MRLASELLKAAVLSAALCIGGSAWAQVSVSGSGTATYSHPISVPPGISGMQPNLALVYAGGGINGPVGHGWSLQGVSAITRCPSIVKVDSISRGVAFDGNDKLCLDGQRLIQTSATGAPVVFPQTGDALGLSGTAYREYRLENDTFSRIRAYGMAGTAASNGPQYFKVWTKAGQIYEYGSPFTGATENTLASATVLAQGKTQVAVWAVARISDVVGNYMDFRYAQRDIPWGSVMTDGPAVGHEWNLKEIHYTGKAGQAPVNKVVLTYTDRTDGAETFQNGSKNVSVQRLDKIETYINSPNNTALGPASGAIRVKLVQLGYEVGSVTNRSRLVSIAECTSSSVCQNPVRFNYQTGGDERFSQNSLFAAGVLPTTPMYTSGRKFGTEVIDYDGDGRADLLRWGGVDPTLNRLYKSNGDGSFTEVSNFNIKGADEWLFSDGGCQGSVFADFDGDGLVDILRYSKIGGTSCGAKPTYLYINQGTGAFTRVTITAIDLTIRQPSDPGCDSGGDGGGTGICWPGVAGTMFYVLDVDGDGRMDIVRTATFGNSYEAGCSSSSPCTWVYKGLGGGSFSLMNSPTIKSASLFQWVSGNALKQQEDVIDVDGDGLQDIVLPGKIWRSLGNGDLELITQSTEVADCKNKLDFNGDGRTDCLFPSSDHNSKLRASTGMLLKKVTNFDDAWGMQGSSYGVRMIDLNGDGRTDLIRWSDTTTNTVALISRGNGVFTQSTSFDLNTEARRLVTGGGSYTFITGDFLGNGSQQILRLKESPSAGEGSSNQLYQRTDPSVPDLLTSVISPSGLKTAITYTSMAATGQTRYVSDRSDLANKAVYPFVDLTVASPVISSIESDTGVGSSKVRSEYAYRGMKAAVDGRGVLGFRQTIQQTSGPQGSPITVRTSYLMDKPYAGVARSTETRLGTWDQPAAQLLSRTSNIYCDRTSSTDPNTASEGTPCATTSKLTRPYLRRSLEEGWDLNGAVLPTVTTVNEYNDLGDPTVITVTTQAQVAGGNRTYQKLTTNVFCSPDTVQGNGQACPNKISGDNWILGRLVSSTVNATAPNLLGALSSGAGSAPMATAVTGTLPPDASLPMNPAVLSVILQLLLED